MHHNGFRPTLGNTLHQMAQVNLAIWRDYRDCARARRRARKASRSYLVKPQRMGNDWGFWLPVAVASGFVIGIVISGGWSPFITKLAKFATTLGGLL